MKFRLSSFVPSSLVDRHFENSSATQASVIGDDTSISARTDTISRKEEIFPLSWVSYYLSLRVTVDFHSKVISSFSLSSWQRLKAGLQVRRKLISKVNSDQNQMAARLHPHVTCAYVLFFCFVLLVFFFFFARITFELILALSTIVRPYV